MTRLLVIPVFLLIAVVVLSVIGLAGSAPVALVLALMCASPLFMFSLGWAFGKASNEFTLVRKSHDMVTAGHENRVRRPQIREPLS